MYSPPTRKIGYLCKFIYLGECYNWEGLYQDAKEHYFLAYQEALHRNDTLCIIRCVD